MSPFIFVAIALAPITGIAVRHRAGYFPKPKGDAEGHILRDEEPRLTLHGLVKKVWGKEGLEGFYRGSAPIILNSFMPLFTKFFASPSPITLYANPSILFNMLYIPFLIISYRAITTPHLLPYKNPLENLKIIFTSQERKRPYIIYFTPGLVVAFLLSIVLQCFVLLPLRSDLWRAFRGNNSTSGQIIQMAGDILMISISTLVLCPIDVVITRLVIQRNYGGPRFKKLPQLRWPRRSAAREVTTAENTAAPGQEKDLEMAVVDEDGEVDIGDLRTPITSSPFNPPHPQSTKQTTSGESSKSPSTMKESSEDEEDEEEQKRELIALDTLDDPVVRYRKEPYLSFIDCIKSIVREEGVMTLYRAWWLTMMGQWFQPEVVR